ncbi:MAG TPA: hypothetical protein VLM38_16105, partial [Blastocatellia bacterium]|nr:hypothetical protein [Blastocatellia bacterium]
SKFTASTFLAGFGLTIVSGQVFTIWQSSELPLLFPLTVGIMAAAIVLFVKAVVRLDELTMPKRFWEESAAAANTGHSSRKGYLLDDDLWELRKHMIFYWTRLTIVATWLTGISVLAMLVPYKPLAAKQIRLAAFALALLGAILGIAYCTIVIAVAERATDETKRLKPLMRQFD